MSIRLLPVEVSVMIFKLLLLRPFRSYREFALMRLSLCSICSAWTRIIFSESTFWTWIFIDFVHPDSLVQHLARSGARLLNLHLDFNNVTSSLPLGMTSDSVISSRLALIIPLIDRWASLYVLVDTRNCLSRIREILLPFTPVLLRRLTVIFRSPFNPLDGFIEPVALFQPLLPSLQLLRIRSSGFAWNQISMASLKHLEIDMLPRRYFPSYADYSFIITKCTQLTYLQLRWTGCSDFDFQTGVVASPVIRSASITTLVLAFDGNPSLGHLVALFRFERLHTLHIEIQRFSHLACVFLCTPIFGDNLYFQFNNPNELTALLWALCRHAPPPLSTDVYDFDFVDTHYLLIDNNTGHSVFHQTAFFNPVPFDQRPLLAAHRAADLAPNLTLTLDFPSVNDTRVNGREFERFSYWQPLEVTPLPWDTQEAPDFSKIWSIDYSLSAWWSWTFGDRLWGSVFGYISGNHRLCSVFGSSFFLSAFFGEAL
ncbi:hypothetical protein C8J57DRAFT_1570319 [Mycena rebaudengoi]|nr:hypothetical protein C8J57DRAFT_1570319 [Mycena rebaudengoi]